jgi:hypothetical protein
VKDINPGSIGVTPIEAAENGAACLRINPGSIGSEPRFLTNVNGRLYFVAEDGVHGWELFGSGSDQADGLGRLDHFPERAAAAEGARTPSAFADSLQPCPGVTRR